jgi:hypothetical protein
VLLAFRELWGPDLGIFLLAVALVAIAAGILLRVFGKSD